MLLREDEKITLNYKIPKRLEAPVISGTIIGTIDYYVNEELWKSSNVIVTKSIPEIDYNWTLKKIIGCWLL